MRSSIVVAHALAVVGCDDVFGLHRPDAPPLDAPASDADVTCFGSSTTLLPEVCVDRPTGPLVIPRPLDTDDNATCTQVITLDGRELCVMTGTTATIATGLAPTGSRPLVIAVTETLVLDQAGVLDLSGSAVMRAAGSEDRECVHDGDDGKPDTINAPGASGGAGGSFLTKGSDGGTCSNQPGAAAPPALLSAIRGGCRGGAGGRLLAGTAAPPGAGGGALYLVAGHSIEIRGVIDVSGDGGAGGQITGPDANGGGGGGGGSGGLIGLHAPTITIRSTARMASNGGGGGGGASASATTAIPGNGGRGRSADPINGVFPFSAPGGPYGTGGNLQGGGGANGEDGVTPVGTVNFGCSGGGGAGAVGAIRAFSATVVNESTQISPALVTSPVP